MTEQILIPSDIECLIGDQYSDSRHLYKYPIFKNLNHMFSPIDVYGKPRKLRQFKDQGARDFANYTGNGMIWHDSGSYSVFSKNKRYPTLDEYMDYCLGAKIDKQKDMFVSLDYITNPLFTKVKRRNYIILTSHNFFKLRQLMPQYYNNFGLAIQGFGMDEIELAFRPVMNGNEKVIFIGSFFPLLGRKGIKNTLIRQKMINVVKYIYANRHLFRDTNFHSMGASGPTTILLSIYGGLGYFDNQGSRIRAKYGKIFFTGDSSTRCIPEAYVGKRGRARFGVKRWYRRHNDILMQCECPSCQGLNYLERRYTLRDSFNARFVHNVYHTVSLVNFIKEDLAPNPLKYQRYLLNLQFKNNGFYRNWVKGIDAVTDTKDIELFLRTPLSLLTRALSSRLKAFWKTDDKAQRV